MGPGSFRRPDILLESSSGTQLWIEIFVTHQNTEDKLHEAKKRNVKVVEIHITDEQCKGIEDIRSHRIGLSEGTTLFNFNPKPILSLPIEVELPCMNYFVYEVKNGCANMEYRGEYDRDHDDSAEYYLAGKLNHGKCWNDDRVSGKRLSSLSVAELEDLCYKRFSGRRSSDISGLIVHEYRAPNKEEEARKNRRQADRMKIRVKEKPFSEELFSKLQQKQEVVLMEAVDYIPHYHVPDPAEWVDLNLPSGNLWSSCDGHWPESHLVGYDLCVPRRQDIEELKAFCRQQSEGDKICIIGRNDKAISFRHKKYTLSGMENDNNGLFYNYLNIYSLPNGFLHVVESDSSTEGMECRFILREKV